jgi:hypothetical protein
VPAVYTQSSSSYSRIGLGDPVYSFSGRRLGMGQLGVAVADRDYLGTINPAGWNKLARTRIEFGLTYNGVFIQDNASSFYTGEAEFTGFSIGIPVSTVHGIGVSAGIIPYTNVSYKVNQNIGIYDIEYEGRGGLSKVFIGSSYALPFGMAIGAELDYYFGNLDYYSRITFVDPGNIDSEYRRTYSPNSVGGTFGLISPDLAGLFGTESISDVRLGVSAAIMSKMSTDTVLISSSALLNDSVASGKVNIEVPVRIAAGLSFTLSNNYLFMFDYLHQGWQDYRFNGLQNANLRSSMKLSAGFEYRPDRQPGDTFLEQIIFRGGLTYEELPYVVSGIGIDEYAVSAGLSLPLGLENTIDIGIQYASRGTKDNGLLKEDRIRLSVGLSLGDIWFIRKEN